MSANKILNHYFILNLAIEDVKKQSGNSQPKAAISVGS